jgi:hypothetical protein
MGNWIFVRIRQSVPRRRYRFLQHVKMMVKYTIFLLPLSQNQTHCNGARVLSDKRRAFGTWQAPVRVRRSPAYVSPQNGQREQR